MDMFQGMWIPYANGPSLIRDLGMFTLDGSHSQSLNMLQYVHAHVLPCIFPNEAKDMIFES
jgi:hypothetical protein